MLALAACSAGVGPIGVDVIAQREGPGSGTPAAAPASPGGGGTPSGSFSCAGTYACSVQGSPASLSAELAEVGGRCEAQYQGVTIVLESDGRITVSGSVYGSWEARPDGSIDVCTTDNTCASCSRSSAGGTGDKALGEGPCSGDTDCQLGACFDGKYCSLPCTPSNAATICAVAPFDGVCAPEGLCSKP